MKTFAEWMKNYREIFDDVETEDDPELKLKNTFGGGGYEVNFSDSQGDQYKVVFDKLNYGIATQSVSLPAEVYKITFKNEESGMYLTGKNRAGQVYTKMLKAIKLFLTRIRPDGISFQGNISRMNGMYNIFIKKFLSDRPGKSSHLVFYPIDQETLISKAFIESQPPQIQSVLQGKITNQPARIQGNKKNVKQPGFIQRMWQRAKPQQAPAEPNGGFWN